MNRKDFGKKRGYHISFDTSIRKYDLIRLVKITKELNGRIFESFRLGSIEITNKEFNREKISKNKKKKTFFETFAEATNPNNNQLTDDKDSLIDSCYQRALENIKIRKNINFNVLVKEVKENNHVSI